MRFQLLYRCLLCGTETAETGRICIACKNSVRQIDREQSCRVCGLPLISEKERCLRCRDADFHFIRNISLFEYRDTARDIFYQYKFRNHKVIASWYAELLHQLIPERFPDYSVVPSPGNRRKKVRKGWDQVEQITSLLMGRYGLNVVRALSKESGTDQKTLDLAGRRNNLRNRIRFTTGGRCLRGRKVLLIDDIFTTGATADECSRILMENGVLEVVSMTIAID